MYVLRSPCAYGPAAGYSVWRMETRSPKAPQEILPAGLDRCELLDAEYDHLWTIERIKATRPAFDELELVEECKKDSPCKGFNPWHVLLFGQCYFAGEVPDSEGPVSERA